eukprot:TRINITY_DN17609_c0_g1_i2.p1 TRINITY_DN17609_c0_g1~~TRINITY_DN17609_c0_g1_i2.p1  ORF type:complete len:127 (-),score=5.38 TRINITY_DN17609_c0_g1_i2:183-563(-)
MCIRDSILTVRILSEVRCVCVCVFYTRQPLEGNARGSGVWLLLLLLLLKLGRFLSAGGTQPSIPLSLEGLRGLNGTLLEGGTGNLPHSWHLGLNGSLWHGIPPVVIQCSLDIDNLVLLRAEHHNGF